CQQHKSHPLTF
nr:immunoglobulin light chain junction region [Macaca mulatta]MOX48210.1 immunoglobulin light chain junction region [Macaca mulatta]MOX48921.1 immunoglobulin light chain junction region [Macaca mulatta]MOX50022.1 immunoglobulin light chain junction region [Macaca mulatta]MOX50185.1 immunoglobulin light chain junction region [Macaca mulatta]